MRLAEAAKSQSDWQALMAEASVTWKDEAWTLCFILILLMCFVPPLQDAGVAGKALLYYLKHLIGFIGRALRLSRQALA